jgi:hypothetical protein
MRAKHRLLQLASLGVLTGILVSPVLAQISVAEAQALAPDAGPGFGFGSEALQPANKALGATGHAIDEAAGRVTGKR